MTFKAVIFDWDEVVVKSDPFSEHALTEVLGSRGLPLLRDWYRRYFYARTLKDGLADYLRDVHQPLQLIPELVIHKKTFDVEYEQWVAPYEDALDLIARLRENYPLAIASGTRRNLLDVGLRKFGITDAFSAIATSEDYQNGKPAPDAFLAALAKLNFVVGITLGSQNILVIEDAPMGVKAAKRAKMFCAAVTHTHDPKQLHEADFVVNDLRDLNVETLTAEAK